MFAALTDRTAVPGRRTDGPMKLGADGVMPEERPMPGRRTDGPMKLRADGVMPEERPMLEMAMVKVAEVTEVVMPAKVTSVGRRSDRAPHSSDGQSN